MSLNLKKFLTSIIIVISFITINTTSYLANSNDSVKVYINSSKVEFNDADPQIINSRVMVPFRVIAEALGAEVDWNKTTETMTLTKGSLTVVHTLRSSIITVNGTAITFDTPSTVINSRTLMPVRMIAEALNCQVSWDNDNRSVNISVGEAFVNSVITDNTSISDGEKLTITVNASENTERIKIVDTSDSSTLVESYTYTTIANGSKVFSIPWVPQEGVSSVKTLKVFAGNLLSYNEDAESTKTFSLMISGNATPTITKVDLSNDTIARNQTINITVYANASTSKIKIKNNLGDNLTEITNYTLSGSTRVFKTELKMTSREVTELYAYAGDSSGYQTSYFTTKIKVTGTTSSNSEKLKATLTIHEVEPSKDTIYVGEDVTLKIYTSSDISRVEIQDSNEKVVQKINFAYSKNTANNEYIWYSNFNISNSGRNKYYIVAYNSDEKSTKETITLTADTYSKNELTILNITQKTADAVVGDNVTFSVKTTSQAKYIEVREGSNVIDKITSYSSSDSTRTFTFKIKLTSSNVSNLRVVAYDSSGLSISQRVYPDYTEHSEPKIYEVDIKNSTVSLNEYAKVSVYTNSAVSKVWIVDENDVRVVLSTQHDDSSGDEYIWDLKFPTEKTGNRVLYTIYAQGEDKLKDEYSFRIKVTN